MTYIQILLAWFFVGVLILLWHRALRAAGIGVLHWQCCYIGKLLPTRYPPGVKYLVMVIFWLFVTPIGATGFWWLTEQGYLVVHSIGAVVLYCMFLWLVSIGCIIATSRSVVQKKKQLNVFYLVLESLVSWLLFAFIFGLLVS